MTSRSPRMPTARERFVAGATCLALLLGLLGPIRSEAHMGFWPFTSLQLFSHVRSERSISYRVSATTAGDPRSQHDIDLSEAGAGYRGWFQIAKQLPRQDSARQQAICRAWKRAAASFTRADELQVWQVVTELDPGAHGVRRHEIGRRELTRC